MKLIYMPNKCNNTVKIGHVHKVVNVLFLSIFDFKSTNTDSSHMQMFDLSLIPLGTQCLA